ncbi:MAG: hypothetical protein C4530_00745 [Desulfobacteraceae bacterium]|nr:MAG: hypothetical protein C4530_00745 [Desulfobacteraceae bacterium]
MPVFLPRNGLFSNCRQRNQFDYVLETPDETIPIEVKATDAPSLADASNIKRFLEAYPQKARRGFVVCRCRAPRRLADNIDAVLLREGFSFFKNSPLVVRETTEG